MTTTRTFRLRAAALVVAGVPLLAACGGSSEPAASTTTASSGTQASAQPSGAAQDGASTPPVTGAATEPAALIASAAQSAGKVTSAHLMMTIEMAQGTINADAQVGYNPQRMSMTMSGLPGMSEQLGGSIQQVLVDNVMYLQAPTLGQATGKKWIKIDLADAAASQGLDLSALLAQSDQADPSQAVKLLEKSADLTEVGTEKVAGVETRHLRGTIDLTTSLAAYDEKLRTQLEKMLKGAQAGTMDLDVWIDADNLPRKTVQSYTVDGQDLTVTILVDSYNQAFTVTAPPAAEVADLAALTGS